MTQNQRKTLVLGLDGAPHPLIKRWSEEGYLPNLKRLIDSGSFGVLRSTIPVHSPTAWASFITGLNPGKHGVYDFVRRGSEDYQLKVVRADQIVGDSLWRLMSEEGLRVGVMNVPMTYPPEPVNGFLLSGLGTPDFTSYSYPPQLSVELDQAGYRVNKKFFFKEERQDEWLTDIREITDIRGATAERLMSEKEWDFFMVVFRNSDEICHFFWHHMDESHPWHDPAAAQRYRTAIRDLYQQIDGWVGRLAATAGEDANIVVMSDHGAGPLYRDVFLNEWLIEQGWLKLKVETPTRRGWMGMSRRLGLTRENISDVLSRLNLQRLEKAIKDLLGDRILILPRDERPEFFGAVDWSQTQAYSFGYYGQIYLNVDGREPQGIVTPGAEYEELRREIAGRLKEMTDPADGKRVVDRLYLREELYSGPFVSDAPDLLAIMRGLTYMTRKGYEFAAQRGVLFREPYTRESGSHRMEGILIASGPDIKQQPELVTSDIQDLSPTLLYLQDTPLPEYMDGRLIEALLKPEILINRPPRMDKRPLRERDDALTAWDAEKEAELVERLKNLGYLG